MGWGGMSIQIASNQYAKGLCAHSADEVGGRGKGEEKEGRGQLGQHAKPSFGRKKAHEHGQRL